MPAICEYPRLRKHSRAGAKGKTWTSYYWDGRAIGMKDVALGNNYEIALAQWRICEEKYQTASIDIEWRGNASEAFALTERTAGLMAMLLAAEGAGPQPGVYFLLTQEGAVQYVGQSENVLNRVAAHTAAKGFARVRMLVVENYDERMELERHFIRLMKPPLNIQLVGTRLEAA